MVLLRLVCWAALMHIPGHRLASWSPCPGQDYPGRDFLCFSANDFGLFLSDEDPKKGIWLEAGKALDYYMLRNGVSIYPTSFQLVPALAPWLDVPAGSSWCGCLPCCLASCPAAPHVPPTIASGRWERVAWWWDVGALRQGRC